MANSSFLKIDRATEHIDQLKELFRRSPPFSYIVETNTKTGERATFAKQDEAVTSRAAIIAGDAIHALRTALDHTFFDIVLPSVETDREKKTIQFPFSETADRLDEAVRRRLAHKVSDRFFDAIIALKPHGQQGGNKLLYLVHELDIIDKHRLLVPTGDYRNLSGEIIRAQVPDFPKAIGSFATGMNHRDVVWPGEPISRAERRARRLPEILEEKLDVPVEIIFSLSPLIDILPVVPTLYAMRDATTQAVADMLNAAN